MQNWLVQVLHVLFGWPDHLKDMRALYAFTLPVFCLFFLIALLDSKLHRTHSLNEAPGSKSEKIYFS